MNSSYGSAALVPEQLEAQFAEDEALGMMYPLSEKEARRRFDDISFMWRLSGPLLKMMGR